MFRKKFTVLIKTPEKVIYETGCLPRKTAEEIAKSLKALAKEIGANAKIKIRPVMEY